MAKPFEVTHSTKNIQPSFLEIDIETFKKQSLFSESAWKIRSFTGEELIFDFSEFRAHRNLTCSAKELLLSYCKEDDDGTLTTSEWSIFKVKRVVKILNSFMRKEKLIKISDLTLEHYEQLLSNMLKGDYDEGELIAFSTYKQTINTLFTFQDLYLSRKSGDGPSVTPSPNNCYALAKSTIESLGEDYPTWVSGSRLDGLPMSLLILFLGDAISIIRSDETKYLLAFFEYQKVFLLEQNKPKRKNGKDRNSFPTSSIIARLHEFFLSEKAQKTPKTINRLYSELPEYCARECDVASVAELPLQTWPFKAARDITRHIQSVYEAGFIIFSCVTGARRNELENLQVSDLIKKKDGSFGFRSSINKTNHGIPTIRTVTGLAAEVVAILERLLLQDKRLLSLPLFLAPQGLSLQERDKAFSFSNCTNLAGEQSARWILKRYIAKRFLVKQPKLALELDRIKVTPHRFRHAFAEFALRRFDGNVPDLIRRHFRHHYGSFMTSMYTFGKINISETYTAEQMGLNYLSELGLNWLNNKEDLYGPIGISIKQKLTELHFLAPDELQQELNSWIEQEFTGQIKAMEYGFCVLRYKTIKSAKCCDKPTGVPLFEEASVSLCSGCAHLISIESQREDIIRIGQSISEQLKSFQKLGVQPLITACREELKSAEAILKLFELRIDA